VQIGRVFGLAEQVGTSKHGRRVEVAELQADLLQAHDLQTLAVLDRADERRSFVETFMRSRVQPSIAATEPAHL
jgi:hypothetical protein